MDKITAVVIGYGNRGSVYCCYEDKEPTKFKVVGVVDKNPIKIKICAEKYKIPSGNCFGQDPDVELNLNLLLSDLLVGHFRDIRGDVNKMRQERVSGKVRHDVSVHNQLCRTVNAVYAKVNAERGGITAS